MAPIKFMFREGNINTNIFSPSLNTANDSGFWWVISSLYAGIQRGLSLMKYHLYCGCVLSSYSSYNGNNFSTFI